MTKIPEGFPPETHIQTIKVELGKNFFNQVAIFRASVRHWEKITGALPDDNISERLNIMSARYARQNPDALTDVAVYGYDSELTEAAAADVRKLVDDFHSQLGKEPVEILPTVADRYVYSMTKLSNYLFDPKAAYGKDDPAGLVTGRDRAGNPIQTYVYVDPQGADHLTADDARVFNAMLSIWDKQKSNDPRGYCTLSELVYAAGLSNCDTNRDFILLHLRRMNRYSIRIDDSDEVAAGLGYTPKPESEGRLIDYRILPVRSHGKVTDQGIYFSEPFLVDYSKRHGNQISSAKHAVLEYPLNNSSTVIALSEYLNKYLAWKHNEFFDASKSYAELSRKAKKGEPVDASKLAKAKQGIEPTAILFSTLYAKAGKEGSSRTILKRVRDQAGVILQHYANEHLHHVQSVTKGKDRFLVRFENGMQDDEKALPDSKVD